MKMKQTNNQLFCNVIVAVGSISVSQTGQYSEIAVSTSIRTSQKIHVHLVQSSQEKRLDIKTFSMQTRPSIRRCTPLKMNKDNILW